MDWQHFDVTLSTEKVSYMDPYHQCSAAMALTVSFVIFGLSWSIIVLVACVFLFSIVIFFGLCICGKFKSSYLWNYVIILLLIRHENSYFGTNTELFFFPLKGRSFIHIYRCHWCRHKFSLQQIYLQSPGHTTNIAMSALTKQKLIFLTSSSNLLTLPLPFTFL